MAQLSTVWKKRKVHYIRSNQIKTLADEAPAISNSITWMQSKMLQTQNCNYLKQKADETSERTVFQNCTKND